MQVSIYRRHRFHSDLISRAVWMYYRFNLIFRDVEVLMAEQGVDVSYETVRQTHQEYWLETRANIFNPRIAIPRNLSYNQV